MAGNMKQKLVLSHVLSLSLVFSAHSHVHSNTMVPVCTDANPCHPPLWTVLVLWLPSVVGAAWVLY